MVLQKKRHTRDGLHQTFFTFIKEKSGNFHKIGYGQPTFFVKI